MNGPASNAYEKFCNYEIPADYEASIMTLIRLNEVMMSINGSFQSVELEVEERGETNPTACSEKQSSFRGGRLRLDSVRHLKSILPNASFLVLNDAHNNLSSSICTNRRFLENEPFFLSELIDMVKRSNNSNRKYRLGFLYPRNGAFLYCS